MDKRVDTARFLEDRRPCALEQRGEALSPQTGGQFGADAGGL